MSRFLPVHFLAAVVLTGTPGVAAPDWTVAGGHRSARLLAAAPGNAGFTLLPPSQHGVAFTNVLSEENGLANQILMSGSGVACGDVDGDGWSDVYLCGLDSPNRLFRNLGGWRFEDITDKAGVACSGMFSTGAALADADGDGDLDLLLNGLGRGTQLLLNDGKARFAAAAAGAGLASESAAMSMALADIDGDGDLDLYVTNYRTNTFHDLPGIHFRIGVTNGLRTISSIAGRPPTAEERIRYSLNAAGNNVIENGEADALHLNDGHGRFTTVSWTGGAFTDEEGRPLAAPPYDWGYAAMFRDMNGDGTPDLYVCNDNESIDRCWLNDGRGRFRAAPPLMLRQTSFSSMGVDFADLNRDGLDEFFVADMLAREHALRHRLMAGRTSPGPPGLFADRPAYGRNTLFLNRGDGTYAEIAQFAGLESSDWSWCPVFLDVDLDGYEDLLVTTGLERSLRDADARREIDGIKAQRALTPREFQGLRRAMPRLETPAHAFRNRGDLTFENVTGAWGLGRRGVAQGMALADLDNDGDFDVVANNLNGPAVLYRNNAPSPRVAVRLKGSPPNTRGIGAKIKVLGGSVPQSQEMMCGGRYLSSDDALRVFAAGSATNVLRIEVTWRSGRRSVVTNAAPNRLYEIDEAASQPAPAHHAPRTTPLFTDASALLNHTHHEEPFDDFAVQPTLSRRLSQSGPGLAWFDVDADGWDDLFIASGKGGRLVLLHNDGRGGFARVDGPLLNEPAPRDQTAVVGFRAAEARPLLLAGSANYEDGVTPAAPARQFDLGAGDVRELAPAGPSSAGPLALADVDGDGLLDLFVGGRVIPRRWPEAASSVLYRGTTNGFVFDAGNSGVLTNAGLVSGAVFSDLDADGLPELILACEWGPLKIFRNQHGSFAPWNPPLNTQNSERKTLGHLTGLWNGVTAGDFDGDGRLDLAAANWGRNSHYESFRARPLRLFHGELFPGGAVQAVEGYEEPGTGRLLPLQPFHVIGLAMPAVRERVGTFEAYALRALPEIYGDAWRAAKELPAAWLESTVFLNRGDRFEARPLPVEAQFAPAFALCAADFDGDGREDLFLSQNFFAVTPERSRLDAGRGLLLRGDGAGGFAAMSGQESGLLIYGEQRGAAACDYDGDGRADLAVSQNGAETKLYRNTGAKPGLRVRLAGPPANAAGIGAVLRASAGGKSGPAREIHAGSGYWSQDSAVPVLGGAAPLDKLEVRWPGGRVTASAVPPGVRELTVDATGAIIATK